MKAIDVLSARTGEWINDLDIIDQAGLGALTELRQLRQAGSPLRARPHPNGQGLQWRLDAPPVEPPPEPRRRPFPIERTTTGGFRLRELTCLDCEGTYVLPYINHIKGPQHQDWIKRMQATLLEEDSIPVVETKPMEGPRIVFGEARVCDRCKGVLRPERKDRKGNILPADTYTHDPKDKDGRCTKCDGLGVVQRA